MSIGAGILYVVLADSEVQPWNTSTIKNTEQDRELENLKADKNYKTQEAESDKV